MVPDGLPMENSLTNKQRFVSRVLPPRYGLNGRPSDHGIRQSNPLALRVKQGFLQPLYHRVVRRWRDTVYRLENSGFFFDLVVIEALD